LKNGYRIAALALLASIGGCASKMSYPQAQSTQGTTAATTLNVVGAPLGSIVRVNGNQVGPIFDKKGKPVLVSIPSGTHRVEIMNGDLVLYNQTIIAVQGNSIAIRVTP
jgi:hypothetical protein